MAPSPDTSAQGAPVASQEAEARRDVYRAFAAHMKVVGLVDPPTAENVPDALDAYAAVIRASERERYAALVEGVRALHNGHGGAICHSACHALAALEEAGSA